MFRSITYAARFSSLRVLEQSADALPLGAVTVRARRLMEEDADCFRLAERLAATPLMIRRALDHHVADGHVERATHLIAWNSLAPNETKRFVVAEPVTPTELARLHGVVERTGVVSLTNVRSSLFAEAGFDKIAAHQAGGGVTRITAEDAYSRTDQAVFDKAK